MAGSPPSHQTRASFGFFEGGGLLCLFGDLIFFFSLKTLELSSQKIASAQGTAGQKCSHWV